MDISKYKPTQKILDKLEGYRQKGSKVNVKAITNPDKLFTYYYASKLMGWRNLENDIWDTASYEDRQTLKEIDNQVSADTSLGDSRSKDEVSLQEFSKVVAAYLKEKGLSYTFGMRSPHYNELEMDRRNGRCWTIAYTLLIEGTLKIDFANHTNEGGGTYGYSIDHYGWNVIGKKELEAIIVKKIEDSGLVSAPTAFAEEFDEYENMWDPMVESREDRIKRLQKKQNKLAFKQSVLETQLSSVLAEIPGTNKRIEYNGVPHRKALRKLLGFINTLTPEEKLELYFNWSNDIEAGDYKGDPILNKDSGDDCVYDNTWTAEVPEDTYDRVVTALGI